MGSMTGAFVAFGGNLGDVQARFLQARRQLAMLPGTHVVASSPWYRTLPIGPPGQPEYCNAVVQIRTSLPAVALLRSLLRIERELGRIRPAPRWSARTIDLDLLDYGGCILDTPELTLPHPRLHERLFVLRPLCDLAPDWLHPRMQSTALALHDALIDSGAKPLGEGLPW